MPLFSIKYVRSSNSLKLKSISFPSIVTVCAILLTVIPAISSISSSSPVVLLKSALTLAVNIFGLKGLEIYSSTPNSNPLSSSCSSLLAVSIRIGTFDNFLTSLQSCHPSIFGIITSIIIRSISLFEPKISSAASPSSASHTT